MTLCTAARGDRKIMVLYTSRAMVARASQQQIRGELRSAKPYIAGRPSTLPEGWVIELSASGTSVQKAQYQLTELVAGVYLSHCRSVEVFMVTAVLNIT